MAVSVRSSFAWIRRAAGWCFSVEERLADLVLFIGGAALLLGAAAVWGLISFAALSNLQQRALAILLCVAVIAWLLALAVLQQRGWLKVFGPLLYFDLVRIARRSRYLLLRFLYSVLLGLVLCWLYLILHVGDAGARTVNPRDMVNFAETFFYTFVFVQFAVISLLTPAYTAGAIAEEKERRTLEFVLATDLRNREIVLSKLMSRLANLSLLVLTGLPILGFLQFLGGVDPNLVAASFAGTILTMVSLACLSILNSVLTRRARDAIALTYLAAVGYLALSGASWWLLNPDWKLASWPAKESPVQLEDVVHIFSAGNPIALIVLLLQDMDKGKYISDVLPGLLLQYTFFHGCFALLCAGWSVLRLRSIALRQAQGETPRRKQRRRLLPRPSVGTAPMMWKEVFAERGLRMHILMRVFVALLVLSSFAPAVFMLSEPWEALASDMNMWVRVVGTTVACLMLLAVAARSAGCVSGERDRQTLDALLTTPLAVNSILAAKWLGNILTVRKGWIWLGAIYVLGVATGGLSPFAIPVLSVAWLVYAGVVSAIGMWYSIACRTTLRATVWTFFVTAAAAVGHWLLWLCATPILMMGKWEGDFLRWVINFQLGLTPPYALGAAFSFADDDRLGGRHQDVGETIGFAIVGLLVWAVVAAMTYAAGRNRFAEITGRFRLGPAERPPLAGVPTPEMNEERSDDGKPAAPDQAPDPGAFTAND